MRSFILTAFLLAAGSLSMVGQDVIVSGGADFKRLCEGNTLPAEE